jgi:hypothetical protein
MAERDRDGDFRHGLIAALAVAFVVIAFATLLGQHKQYNDEYADASEFRSERADIFTQDCSASLPETLASCIAKSLQADREDRQRRYDLRAQQDMSKWVLLTAFLSFAGLAITFAGVYYVAQTLEAALAANRGFRESAERELRAYVQFDGLEEYEPLPGKIGVRSKWKNSGQTPTQAMRMNFGYVIQKDRLSEDFSFADQAGNGLGRASLGSGESKMAGGPLIDAKVYDTVKSGQMRFFYWGWAEYNDVFSNTPRRRSEFCVQLLFTKPNDELLLINTTNHNGLDDECRFRPTTTGKEE